MRQLVINSPSNLINVCVTIHKSADFLAVVEKIVCSNKLCVIILDRYSNTNHSTFLIMCDK